MKYTEALTKASEPIEELNKSYTKMFMELETEAREAGDLGRVTQIRNEVETFKTKMNRATDQRLRSVQSRYELKRAEHEKKERAARIDFDRKYINELKKLVKTDTKAGNVDSALFLQKKIDEMKASLAAAAKSKQVGESGNAKLISFSRMYEGDGCVAEDVADGMRLTSQKKAAGSWFLTRLKYSPPFKATVVAKTDSTNLRLIYAKGRVIFNWEVRGDELRVHDPQNGSQIGAKGQGKIPVDSWVTVEFVCHPDWMSISVDGKERYRKNGNYKELSDEMGVGAAGGSVVILKSLHMEKL